MREYTGPTAPPSAARAPRQWEEWHELDDQAPCPACGEHLIRRTTVKLTLGDVEKRFLGKPQCRNACAQPA